MTNDVKAERDAIVAWLRSEEANYLAFATDGSNALADAIESGQHLQEKNSG